MDVDEPDTVKEDTVAAADLFGAESDYEDDVYRANEVTGGDIPVDIANEIKKPGKKGNLLNIDNFWHNTANHLLDAPRTRKNILWDFMVYHNLREEREGQYVASVQQLEAEALGAIKKAKVAILSEVSENAHVGLFVNEVAAAFDYHVMKMVCRFRLRTMDGSPIFSKTSPDFPDVERKVAIEAYLNSQSDFVKLRAKLSAFRTAKNRLVTSSLTRLLSSVDGMRSKVISELFEPNSSAFRRVTLTRFLRHMDKITNRTEFSGEYRFHLLKAFIKNKDDLETFIQHKSTFVEGNDDVKHFEEFSNTFTPDWEERDIAYDDMGAADYQEQDIAADEEAQDTTSHDHMRDFMNATPPDDFIVSQTSNQTQKEDFYGTDRDATDRVGTETEAPQAEPTDFEKVEETSTKEADAQRQEAEQLKLLEEARKRAAEILRLKRLNRANAAAT